MSNADLDLDAKLKLLNARPKCYSDSDNKLKLSKVLCLITLLYYKIILLYYIIIL
jgi:hypothetical protein